MYKLQISEISPEHMHLYVQRKMQIFLNTVIIVMLHLFI
jgi:hypothetical protein